jgi:hypothetical protein
MSANDPHSLELLSRSTDELEEKIREMNSNDPKRLEYEKELYALSEFRAALKSEKNQLIILRMERLAREIALLEPGNPRRTRIINSILRLTKAVE